ALQSEVAQAVARQVQVKLTPLDQARFAQVHPVDPGAYDAYLQGRYHWHRRTGAGLQPAVQYFEQAIAKDPAYAAPYAGLADCLSVLGWSGFVAPEEGCGRAVGLAQKALEMDRSLAEGHASLAMATANYDYAFMDAEREFEQSIELNPSYATAHHWFGLYLAMMGRYEESYTEHKRAVRLDPHSPMIRVTLGLAYWCARRYDQALEEFEKVLDLDPNSVWAHNGIGYTLRAKSMHERAIAAAQRAVELSRGAPTFVGFLGVEYAAAGHRDEARNILVQLQELSTQRYVTPYTVAQIYAALGETDEALRWLEIAYHERA